MLYAQVVVALPVSGPFDYIVPSEFAQKIKIGTRVWINFCNRRLLGYVVGLAQKTKIKHLKSILELVDDLPILDRKMLLLTQKLADYYCSFWGEAIETALPEGLRKGKKALLFNMQEKIGYNRQKERQTTLIHDLDGKERWDIYLSAIREALNNNQSALVLLPDINCALKAKETVETKLGVVCGLLYRKQPKELDEWFKIKQGLIKMVAGTRSAVFAPLANLGLIIIDEEQDTVYKQEQVPHYHARIVAQMRADIEKTKLILGATSPSLESIYLAKKNKIKYKFIPRKTDFPEIKLIDMQHTAYLERKRNIIFAKFLGDAINSSLGAKEKILLFINRRGFATFTFCHNCGITLRCPRCNIGLVYHFGQNLLNCHYCNFKMGLPKICPHCNSGYIKFGGIGTEKIESELSRIFAQAKIERWDSQRKIKTKDTDIFVATSAVIKQSDYNFDLIGAILIDNSLNRIDFRAAEKTFMVLVGLLRLTRKKLIIQTRIPQHHCFQALLKKDVTYFYEEELKQRRQLKFPPYRHLVLVKLRGKIEERVRRLSNSLFEGLNRANKNKGRKIISVNPGQPAKLRGSYYWQVLVSTNNLKDTHKFLKIYLKDFSHSGIIVTVDVDPL